MCCGAVGFIIAALMGFVSWARAANSPRIDFIDIYRTNIVRVHFGTPPNQAYVLQYINALSSNGIRLTNWSNMYTGYAYPFTNHYIIPDGLTNKSRFYRLKIYP